MSLAKRLARMERELVELRAAVASRDATIAKQGARIAELERELGKNSNNSSKPPSTDSPKDKEARAPRESSGRKPGGQPGHKRSERALLPPERVTRTRPHFPCRCGNPDCRAELPKTPAGEPLREQTIEVLKIVPDVTEDQWHSVQCPKCQHITQARPKGRQRGMCGPNLIAIITLLVGVYQLSRRQAVTCVGDLLGVDLSLGLVSKLEKKVGAMLQPAHDEAARAVQYADAKNLDATPWLRSGVSETLWVIASKNAVVFHIVSNGTQALLEPLMGTLKGILMSDRGAPPVVLEPPLHPARPRGHGLRLRRPRRRRLERKCTGRRRAQEHDVTLGELTWRLQRHAELAQLGRHTLARKEA